jgi:hypothetical protein
MGKLSASLIEEYFAIHLPTAPVFCWRITA